jgi:hypothetical protein
MNIVKPITTAAAIAAMLLAYGIVGTMDYEDAVGQEELYKEMVCAGLWPDYDDRNPDCSASRNTGAHASGAR